MLNKKSVYYIILSISLFFGIFFNKEILKKFTIDNEINEFNLIFLSNLLSIFFLLIFLIFLSFFKKKEEIIHFFIIQKMNFLVFFISIFLTIFIIEIFLNYYDPSKLRNTIVNSKAVEFNAQYIYNDSGFRDEDFKINKNDDEYRIFFIGDSFVHGSAVDNNYTFDKLVESKLTTYKKKINIFNLGIPGTGVSTYLQTLKKFKKFKPDSIFVFIYVDNDINEDNFIINFSSNLNYFLNKSEILKLIKNNLYDKKFYYSNKYINQFNLNKKIKSYTKQGLINVHQLALVFRGNYHLYYADLVDLFINSNQDKKRILEIKNIAKKINSKLHFVIIPSKYQVKDDYKNFPSKEFGVKFDNGIINNDLQKEMVKWFTNNQITIIDLLAYLQKSNVRNYYIIDEHFNKNGNELTRDVILNYIKKNLNK